MTFTEPPEIVVRVSSNQLIALYTPWLEFIWGMNHELVTSYAPLTGTLPGTPYGVLTILPYRRSYQQDPGRTYVTKSCTYVLVQILEGLRR